MTHSERRRRKRPVNERIMSSYSLWQSKASRNHFVCVIFVSFSFSSVTAYFFLSLIVSAFGYPFFFSFSLLSCLFFLTLGHSLFSLPFPCLLLFFSCFRFLYPPVFHSISFFTYFCLHLLKLRLSRCFLFSFLSCFFFYIFGCTVLASA